MLDSCCCGMLLDTWSCWIWTWRYWTLMFGPWHWKFLLDRWMLDQSCIHGWTLPLEIHRSCWKAAGQEALNDLLLLWKWGQLDGAAGQRCWYSHRHWPWKTS
ncbi:unnamed protein product [Cuscuta campestris]|uniref:Uncharacterized protein n=1 Tax=Cuscuta campestris TaxID=132261 RepID=A0A484NPI7_9ASTE|nr:unnamed protein product [Cuscuta campestris]